MLVASDGLAAALDASGLYSEERNWWLWEQVPEELRLVEFSHRTLPAHPAFRWRLKGVGSWRGFDLYSLPEPMQREFAYCFWQIIESGLDGQHQLQPAGVVADHPRRGLPCRTSGRRCARSSTARARSGSASLSRRARGAPGSSGGRSTGTRRSGAAIGIW